MMKLENYTFLSMAFIVIVGLIWLTITEGCRDQYGAEFYPKDAEQVEGLWRQETSPFWYYHFSDGLLHQSIIDFQIPNLVEHYYGFRTNQDTIFLRDMLGNNDRVWTVLFKTDSTATLTDVTGDFRPQYKIKRF